MIKSHPALPPRVAWPWIAGAVAIWVVTVVAGGDPPPVTAGAFEGEVTVHSDPKEGRFGPWALVEVDGVVMFADLDIEVDQQFGRGDRLWLRGVIRPGIGSVGGREYSGELSIGVIERHVKSTFIPHVAGREIRQRVTERLSPGSEGRGLLAGFLVGDTSDVSDLDMEAMRRSGLAHFVAVSGSNVALFLGLLALVTGPLSWGPRRRAVVGLLGLPLYAAATGFEPSVMRASAMAGIALGGRLVGVVLEAWQLLSVAVAGLLLADPALVSSLGFQLSVAATAGVLVGARWPVGGRLRRAIAVTLGAQLGVAPLLLAGFGSVPLLSPVANLVAAPLVTAATLLGAIGVLGPSFLIGPAAWLASLVLHLARGASGWPQVGVAPLFGLAVVVTFLAVFPSWRPVVCALAAVGVTLVVVAPGGEPAPGTVTVLDVGQGDAVLLSGGEGTYSLVDGGPDAAVLLDRLRSNGVGAVTLMVLTHVHADHAAGLVGVVERMPVVEIWWPSGPHETESSNELQAAATARGIPIVEPLPGQVRHLGSLALRVDGPLRRYESANDQSIVLTVTGRARSMLLTGDIERFAQADLAGLRADVLKVPHHGGGTSDPRWLAAVGADLAVIPVGENDFGHPAVEVVDTLQEAGARVMRTD
ncbi:MAG TPA: ComEC/Rec2 family competence protein, partial [Acidimicrobiia bacterium]